MLKGETAFTQAMVEEGPSLEESHLNASRHRVAFEGSYTRKFASDALLIPSIEAGLRSDGGDGETGTGIEIGAGLGYSVGRLAFNVSSRSLLSHSDADEYEELGYSGMVAFNPNSDGKGFSMSLGSSWGVSNPDLDVRSMSSLHDARLIAENEEPLSPSPWLHATVRYDFSSLDGLGFWSSYRGSEKSNEFRLLQLGLKLRSVHGFDAGLEIGHQESIHRPPRQSIELRGTLRW